MSGCWTLTVQALTFVAFLSFATALAMLGAVNDVGSRLAVFDNWRVPVGVAVASAIVGIICSVVADLKRRECLNKKP